MGLLMGSAFSAAGFGMSSLGNSHKSRLAFKKLKQINGLWYVRPAGAVKRGLGRAAYFLKRLAGIH